MSDRQKFAIRMIVGLIIGVSLAVVNAHASVPQEPIDKNTAIMWTFTILIALCLGVPCAALGLGQEWSQSVVFTILIVLHRLFF